jgi:hypothetical protein
VLDAIDDGLGGLIASFGRTDHEVVEFWRYSALT